jgi:hypothetical protein
LPDSIFLITPPFTQLNTPYPATAYLKGFLNTKSISSFQCDLGIEVIDAIFCKAELENIFQLAFECTFDLSENCHRIIANKNAYINTIDAVILFLRNKQDTLAHRIASGNFLPQASRFNMVQDTEWAFGSMGVQDKAKYFATMYLEDLSDLIKECIDTHFGFSRYAERLGRSANSFDDLYEALQMPLTYIDTITIDLLNKKLQSNLPSLICFSVPFPGNLYSAFRCAQFIKKNYAHIKIALGGGFANTELRSISDIRVFEYFDFITLDDGEICLENLHKFIGAQLLQENLVRTFSLDKKNKVVVFNNSLLFKDYKQAELGTPDYSDLHLDKYISAIEIINPMHRLWSDGRWNKLTMAHGCYWGKCTFCDISLDYIKRYEPLTASILVDRMETIIEQTGQSGFHFVDEAAPPALMRAVALEIIKRKLVVSWWTNIRFEKSFTLDLCLLLKASGCIGVSGGLEVASDRLLLLIEKGVTVAQVAVVNKNFTEAGIMVHAYLMYGFPTQTTQETIDSLEMVRQMFALGILQSGYWHQFAMTAHSPVGLNPDKFGVNKINELQGTFANNDIEYEDNSGNDTNLFSEGLKKSLFNFMHGIGLQDNLQKWFEIKMPVTSINKNYIKQCIELNVVQNLPSDKIIFIGNLPEVNYFTQSKKGLTREMAILKFYNNAQVIELTMLQIHANWLIEILHLLMSGNKMTLRELQQSYENTGLQDFELFWYNKPMNIKNVCGLLVL